MTVLAGRLVLYASSLSTKNCCQVSFNQKYCGTKKNIFWPLSNGWATVFNFKTTFAKVGDREIVKSYDNFAVGKIMILCRTRFQLFKIFGNENEVRRSTIWKGKNTQKRSKIFSIHTCILRNRWLYSFSRLHEENDCCAQFIILQNYHFPLIFNYGRKSSTQRVRFFTFTCLLKMSECWTVRNLKVFHHQIIANLM